MLFWTKKKLSANNDLPEKTFCSRQFRHFVPFYFPPLHIFSTFFSEIIIINDYKRERFNFQKLLWKKVYFSFIDMFLKNNISVNYGVLHTLGEEKYIKVSNFLFTEMIFQFIFFLWKYLNFSKNSSYILGISQKYQKFQRLNRQG